MNSCWLSIHKVAMVLLLGLLTSSSAKAQSCPQNTAYSKQNGPWSQCATWVNCCSESLQCTTICSGCDYNAFGNLMCVPSPETPNVRIDHNVTDATGTYLNGVTVSAGGSLSGNITTNYLESQGNLSGNYNVTGSGSIGGSSFSGSVIANYSIWLGLPSENNSGSLSASVIQVGNNGSLSSSNPISCDYLHLFSDAALICPYTIPDDLYVSAYGSWLTGNGVFTNNGEIEIWAPFGGPPFVLNPSGPLAIANNGSISIFAQDVTIRGDFSNYGTLHFGGTLRIEGNFYNFGNLHLSGGGVLRVDGDFINAANIELDSTSVGEIPLACPKHIDIVGAFEQSITGVITVGVTDLYDCSSYTTTPFIKATTGATLNGRLEVWVSDYGYGCSHHKIVRADGGITGQFSEVDILSYGNAASLVYKTDSPPDGPITDAIIRAGIDAVFISVPIHGQTQSGYFGIGSTPGWPHSMPYTLGLISDEVNLVRMNNPDLCSVDYSYVTGDWGNLTSQGAPSILLSRLLYLASYSAPELIRDALMQSAQQLENTGRSLAREASRYAAFEITSRLQYHIDNMRGAYPGTPIYVDIVAHSRGAAVASEVLRRLDLPACTYVSITYLDGIDPESEDLERPEALAGRLLDDPLITTQGATRASNFYAEFAAVNYYDYDGFGCTSCWVEWVFNDQTTDEFFRRHGWPKGRTRMGYDIDEMVAGATHLSIESQFTNLLDVAVGQVPLTNYSLSRTSYLGDVIMFPETEFPVCSLSLSGAAEDKSQLVPSSALRDTADALILDPNFMDSAQLILSLTELSESAGFDDLFTSDIQFARNLVEQISSNRFPMDGPWKREGQGVSLEIVEGESLARFNSVDKLTQSIRFDSLDYSSLHLSATIEFMDADSYISLGIKGNGLACAKTFTAQSYASGDRHTISIRGYRGALATQILSRDCIELLGYKTIIYHVGVQTDCIRCDTSGDGGFDDADVPEFIDVLLRPEQAPVAQICSVDLNNDGFANGADIQLFVFSLLNQMPGELVVNSPSGGLAWEAGSEQTISWISSDDRGDVSIVLMRYDAVVVALDTVPISALQWTGRIPASVSPGDGYSVHLSRAGDCLPLLTSVSNEYFSITPCNPSTSINIDSPSGGESWSVGSTHSVLWTCTNPLGVVTIHLYRFGYEVSVLGSVPMVAQSFLWDIDAFAPGTDYSVVIRGLDDCGNVIEAESNGIFSIDCGSSNSLTLLSPSGGETLTAGDTYSITWTSDAVMGTVALTLNKGDSPYMSVGTASVALGMFDWNICPYLPESDEYSISLSMFDSCSGLTRYEQSGNFLINSDNPTPVSIMFPNGNESLIAGETYAITWVSGLVEGDAYLFGHKNTQSFVLGACPIANETFSWTLCPTMQSASDYRVAICFLGDPLCGIISDLSDEPFTIVGRDAEIVVVSPNGGEQWSIGSTQNIVWQSDGMDENSYLTVYLLRGDAYLYYVGSALATDNVFAWQIPAQFPEAMDYKIRVVGSDCVGLQFGDASDAEFSLVMDP